MNKCFIIGNLTAEPEIRTVTSVKGTNSVCNFTVAVNDRFNDGNATFFRVAAWRSLADACYKYLHKADKVMVSGTISAKPYVTKDGAAHAGLNLTAEDVEFLVLHRDSDDAEEDTYKQQERKAIQQEQQTMQQVMDSSTGFEAVEDDALPF